MDPSDGETSRGRAHDEITNPFIAFRRFADEQMSNLVKGIFGLATASDSSSASPSSSDRAFQDYQAWLRDARASQENLQREQEFAGRIMSAVAEAHRDDAQEHIEAPTQDVDGPLRCPYRPEYRDSTQNPNPDSDHSFASLGIQLPHPFIAAPTIYNGIPPKGVAYLLYSPYSPLHLEQHPRLRDRGIQWRKAFEDLIAIDGGGDMSSERTPDQRLSNTGWVEQMSDRNKCNNDPVDYRGLALFMAHAMAGGSSPYERTEERSIQDAHGADSENADESTEPMTELDLYEHFLGKQDSSLDNESASQPDLQSQSRSYAHLQHDSAPTEESGRKPSILSTLTTTERTSLQDGTIHTKVVLKKRFSDGREESTETMHTQNPTPKTEYQPPKQGCKQLDNSHEPSRSEKEAKKSKGWFWS